MKRGCSWAAICVLYKRARAQLGDYPVEDNAKCIMACQLWEEENVTHMGSALWSEKVMKDDRKL